MNIFGCFLMKTLNMKIDDCLNSHEILMRLYHSHEILTRLKFSHQILMRVQWSYEILTKFS